MPFGFRKSTPLLGGLLRINWSKSGPSVTAKVGPASINSRTRKARVNLPGPFFWRQK